MAAMAEVERLLREAKEEAEKANASADSHVQVRRFSGRAAARHGLTECTNGDARPPCGAEALTRSVTVARHQRSDYGLTA